MQRHSIQACCVSQTLKSYLRQILPLTLILLCQTHAAAQDAAAPVDKPSAEKPATEKAASEKAPTEKPATEKPAAEVAQGHSYHGEAYNEGPRSAAYLMEGMAKLSFPVTTTSPEAQAFVNQGLAQIHGFWYYESERSFRQAAAIDPECAIAYWGMAMANVENLKRAQAFIQQAVDRKAKVTRREQMYIDAYRKFCVDTEDDGKKKIPGKTRAQKYTEALEEIVIEFPDDIEAKALLAGQLWANERNELPILGHTAINALLQQVFDANPMHPAHHYRIHLWDRKKADQALKSSALCGPSMPGIAHMWHMPGHIYSKLHRYQDACWQQEASARVDHAHMMRDRVMPDQIHNFAHNNEWLIRNLIKIGRVDEAISLATNMIELPRHPKYNTLKKSGSAKYGRERLYQTLHAYQLWDRMIEFSQTSYLPDLPDDEDLHLQWSRYVGVAQALGKSAEAAQPILQELQERIAKNQKQLDELTAQDKEIEQKLEALKNPPPPTKQPEPASPETKTPASETSVADAAKAEVTKTDTAKTEVAKPEAAKADEAKTVETQAEGTAEKPQPAPATVPSTAPCDADEKDTAAANQPANQTEGPSKPAEADIEKTKKDLNEQKKKNDESRKKIDQSQKKLEKVVNTIRAAQCASQKRWFDAVDLAGKGEDLDFLTIEWQLAAGNFDKAIEAAKKKVSDLPGEVLPVALQTWIQFQHGGPEAARESFERLRVLCSQADTRTPLLERLNWVAQALGQAQPWASTYKPAEDIGPRPNFDTLGPYRWSPYPMPNITVKDIQGQDLNLYSVQRPTLVVFYLGFGCLHCVEQLKAISPKAEEIRKSGIDLVAVSSENVEQIQTALKNYDKPLDIALHTDQDLTAFKAMRCFDDFEKQPLHGLFLILPAKDGGAPRVCWQDIGFEPFMEIDFVLDEAGRAIKLHQSK